MSLTVVEGTWEEVKLRDAELKGRRVRLTIMPKKAENPKLPADSNTEIGPKRLIGYGMFKGILSTDDYLREKREDTAREDRVL